MKRRILQILLLLGLCAAILAACDLTRPARFPHAVHLGRSDCGGPGQPACLSCATCHQGVRAADDKNATDLSLCKECHQKSELPELMPAEKPPPNGFGTDIRFNHSQHLKMPEVRGQCVTCHTQAIQDRLKEGESPFPPMAACLTCHEHQQQFDKGVCTPCHAQSHLARLVPVTFMRHDRSWLTRHGAAANSSMQMCNQCHSESECADCHVEGSLSIERRSPERFGTDFIHRGDFLTRHALEAASQPATCVRCHTPASCEGCHIQRGVSASRIGSVNPHPPGWVGDPSNRDFHGRAARRDIVGCAACHEQGPATNCILCHRVGGPGGNPHPSGWSSARSNDAAMCRYCHGN